MECKHPPNPQRLNNLQHLEWQLQVHNRLLLPKKLSETEYHLVVGKLLPVRLAPLQAKSSLLAKAHKFQLRSPKHKVEQVREWKNKRVPVAKLKVSSQTQRRKRQPDMLPRQTLRISNLQQKVNLQLLLWRKSSWKTPIWCMTRSKSARCYSQRLTSSARPSVVSKQWTSRSKTMYLRSYVFWKVLMIVYNKWVYSQHNRREVWKHLSNKVNKNAPRWCSKKPRQMTGSPTS